MSVRNVVGVPNSDPAMSAGPPSFGSASGEAPRLCTKNPSKASVRGWTPLT